MTTPDLNSEGGNMVSQRQVELLPCPFCGGEAITGRNRDRHHNDGEWDVYCRECSASVREEYHERTAIEAWNRRAPPAEPRADEGGVSGAERESSASPAHPMGEGQAGDGALYYAKGREVWKRPVATARPGGKSVALGFKVCAVADVVGEEGAATVAAMLTMAERYEERGAAREPMGCPLPGACACPAESDLSGRQGSEANTSEGTLPPAEQITQPSHDDEGLIERLRAEIKELREALDPFANEFGDDIPRDDSMKLYGNLRLGHFRKARSLLSPAQEGLSSARASRDARSST